METLGDMDHFLVDQLSAFKRHSIQLSGELTRGAVQQASLRRQINSDELPVLLPGCLMPQVMQKAHNGETSMDKSISESPYGVPSTVSAEQTLNRRCSRSERGSSTTEASILHSSPPLERSTLLKNVYEDQPHSSVGLPELARNSHQEQKGRSPSYRSLRRTSWIEQSNLSADGVEQQITFAYEHSTAPRMRLSKTVSTSLCNQRSPQSEAKLTYSSFMPDQRTAWHSDVTSPIQPEGQTTVNPSAYIQPSRSYKCENSLLQNNSCPNSLIGPGQQLHKNVMHGPVRYSQVVDPNFDVTIDPLSKPKLIRLQSEPCGFSTVITDATRCGIEQGMANSRRRSEDLKRSLSFEVTLPSYFESPWTSFGAQNQLVSSRPQLASSRPNRRHLSLHLEGMLADFNPLQTGPPLQFHDTHSDNIELQNNRSRARRQDSFCMGICFSDRPVAINEKVCLKIVETNVGWSGLLRFGFTSTNPATVNGCDLPRYACPDLTSKPGYWATALGERYTSTNILIHFSVNRGGHVLYGVNGEEKGVFFSGVVTLEPLWVLLDIYGNTVAVEFTQAGPENELQPCGSDCSANQQSLDSEITNFSNVSLNDAIDLPQESLPPPLIDCRTLLPLVPLKFSPFQGRGILVDSASGTATRLKEGCANPVVFTARPICRGETLVIQILEIDRSFAGGMGFGLTARDPSNKDQRHSPADSGVFLDSNEYWVVNKDVCCNGEIGDELIFSVSHDGEVRYARNDEPTVVLMNVDPTLTLWAFFDVYGSITTIKLVGVKVTPCQGYLCESPTLTCCTPIKDGHASDLPEIAPGDDILKEDTRYMCDACPAAVASEIHACISSPTSLLSSGEYTDNVFSSYPTSTASTPMSPDSQVSLEEEAADCKVCWERVINCVLYTCGHMCLCFDCATIIRGEKGLCPICRQSIVDVIKIYKS